MKCEQTTPNPSFLVDTEAHISLIKIASITNKDEIDDYQTINLRGITQGVSSTLGVIWLQLTHKNFLFEHQFHVIRDDTPIPTDGIIGKDFLKSYECIINYQNMSIFMPKIGLEMPINTDNQISIPPSSESYAYFTIRAKQYPCIIPSQSISNDSMIPTTIVHSPHAFIRVTNTSNKRDFIQNVLHGEEMDDFDVYTSEQFRSLNNDECEIYCMKPYYRSVLEILTDKIPKDAPKELFDLCYEYMPIFHDCKNKLTINNFYKQEIQLTDNIPVYVKNYRLPQSQKSEIKNQVNGLLKDNLIELSQSSYNSPLIVVPKKSSDGTKQYRMCVDYRLLNRKTIPDKFPLPRIDDILDNLGNSAYFSLADLQSGYHQIPLGENSRPMTAFSTDTGMYQWKVLPFGLSIAPGSFCRMMHMAFSELGNNVAFVYMDDLIVLGKNKQEHLQNLRKVFGVCLRKNLKLNPEKCEFFKTEVSFLGHKCTNRGLLPDPAKIKAVQNYPTPTNKDDIKRFVAFCNYYRRFIPNFADIAVPLTKLLSKREEFIWNSETENAFQNLKTRLIKHPILRHPDFSREFIVHVDASQFACGGVLTQRFENDCEQPIVYISKTFKKGELNKPIIEKELLAVHYAITTLRPYLYGKHFTIRTDHKPLIYLYNMKNPASKLTRIRLELEEFDFTIEYVRGKDNVLADALSRIRLEDLKKVYDGEQALVTTRSMSRANKNTKPQIKSENIEQVKPHVIEATNAKFDIKIPRIRLRAIQLGDETGAKVTSVVVCAYQKHKRIFEFCIDKTPGNESLTVKSLISQLQNAAGKFNVKKIQWPLDDFMFTMCTVTDFKNICNEVLSELSIILIKRPILIRTEKEKFDLMSKFHNDALYGGHCGQKRLYARLRAAYYWKNMSKDIRKFVKNCEKCLVNKVRNKNIEPLRLTETPQRPFDVMIIDTIGPFQGSTNGNVYAVTMLCDFSKYLVAIPIPNKSAEQVAKAIFEKFILIYGPMRSIRTDRGSEYRNELMDELCKMMRIKHNVSTAYHHETVGSVERNHRSFNEYLRAYIQNNIADWETFLNYFSFCYNISKNTSLGLEFSPYEVVFNKNVPLPNEIFDGRVDPLYKIHDYVFESKYRLQVIHNRTKELLEKIKLRNKEYYDRNAKPLNIRIGESVLLEIEPYNKFAAKYRKCIVKNIVGDNVEIENENKKIEIVMSQ